MLHQQPRVQREVLLEWTLAVGRREHLLVALAVVSHDVVPPDVGVREVLTGNRAAPAGPAHGDGGIGRHGHRRRRHDLSDPRDQPGQAGVEAVHMQAERLRVPQRPDLGQPALLVVVEPPQPARDQVT